MIKILKKKRDLFMRHRPGKIKFLVVLCFMITVYFSNFIWAQKQSSADKNQPQRITLMTYNVENLFDTEDDPLKDDETYLPLSFKKQNPQILKKCKSLKSRDWQSQCLNLDWSPKVLNSKMKRIADVIVNSHKKLGPDLIFFQEVENLKVLEDLRQKHLKSHYPYPAILIEGPDQRGIDVAVLSRLPLLGEPKLHQLHFKPEKKFTFKSQPQTRDILEASFNLPDQSILTVFAVHFPSQGTPSPARKQALAQLTQLMQAKPKEHFVIAGGDFNITDHEEKLNKYYSKLSKQFLVSHLLGCQSCRGSNYFHPRRSWSFLDALVFSKNFQDNSFSWQLDPKSIRVYNQSLYQNNKWGSPEKFNFKQQSGVSDHWPIVADIVLNSSRSKGIRK
jgi:endonuclease/exonuclease/phosphatase family metal-dependent hydrolase